MNRFLDPDSVSGGIQELPAPNPMTPAELGDTLARLVWESFSDFLLSPELAEILQESGVAVDEGVPPQRESEEILIFHLWAHTRAIQLSFHGREDEGVVKEALDALHRAVFEDMIEHGTPGAQIPVFEQRVSVRYSEYHAAAAFSDERVGLAALGHLAARGVSGSRQGAALLTERAIEVAHPLRDFLDEVRLVV
jgi:hypothetical protein